MTEQWMIISWKHDNYLDAPYGKLLAIIDGTQEEASKAARTYIDFYEPVGIVKVIQK